MGIAEDMSTAITFFETELAKPMSDWFIAEHITGAFLAIPSHIGKVSLHVNIETVDEEIRPWMANAPTLPLPILSTTVKAHDGSSAERRAEDLFDDAKAILLLATPGWSSPQAAQLIIGDSARLNSGHVEGFHGGLQQQARTEACDLLYGSREVAAAGEHLVDLRTQALAGGYSTRHGRRFLTCWS
jgi:hypothetical protein